MKRTQLLALALGIGAIASTAPAALAEKRYVGQAVGGQNLSVDLGSIRSVNPHRVDFTYYLNTEKVVSQADCPAGTWMTLPERQVHRPQSAATTAMLQVVCSYNTVETKLARQALDSNRQPPTAEAVSEVATTLLQSDDGGLYVASVTIVASYALTTNLMGEGGGQTLLKRESNGWHRLAGGGGAMDAMSLTNHGVPTAVATALIQQHQVDWLQTSKALQAFRQSWTAVNPAIAPFLGYWATSGIGRKPHQREASIAIVPSTHAHQVCVVGIGRGFQSVVLGAVSGKALQTPQDVFYSSPFTQRSEGIPSNTLMRGLSGVDTEYQQSDDRQTLYAAAPLNDWYYQADTKQALAAAGCTLKLPSQKP